MASLRRNKNLATDGATPKFLYTILKQLDLKSVIPSHILKTGSQQKTNDLGQVDWNHVAGNLSITNGHAARMRFSRFKQQMEGIPPTPRKARSATTHHRKPKREKAKPKREIEPRKSSEPMIKPEQRDDIEQTAEDPIVHPAAFVKDEPMEEYDPHVGSMEWMEPCGSPLFVPYQEDEVHYSYPDPLQVKQEPNVKVEPDWTS